MVENPVDTDRFDKMRMELRRGALVLGVLAALRKEHYGYSLRKYLISSGLDIDEGTLYPLIRRLEDYGLLVSEWRQEEGRKKRYYRISADGLRLLQELRNEWDGLDTTLKSLLEK